MMSLPFLRALSFLWENKQVESRSPVYRRRLSLETCEERRLLATLFVDDSNQTGATNGSAIRPYTSVQAALTAAASGDTIKVAKGTYARIVVPNKNLQILGGFPGGTPTSYANNQAGNFATSVPKTHITRLAGTPNLPVVLINFNVTAKTIVVDGFHISGGHNGIFIDTDYQLFANITLSDNVIENNGPESLQTSGDRPNGGGIFSSNARLTVINNDIRNNNANRGGGMFISSGVGYTVSNNRILDNDGYDDHGGGVVLVPLLNSAAGNAIFTRNVVRGNEASKAYDYGWGGGMLVAASLNPTEIKPVRLSFNTFSNNYAPSAGGALFVDDGATVRVDHDLMHHNRTDFIGGAIFVDGDESGVGSFLTIVSSTIANNASVESDGNGVAAVVNSQVNISNSIFWFNADDFFADGTSSIAVRYTDAQETWPGTGNRRANPLFANPAAGDYHLQSRTGRYDPVTQSFVQDANHSPAIDAGDPAAAFANETAPNGGRLNLGAYGNTAHASRSLVPAPQNGPTGRDARSILAFSIDVASSGTIEDELTKRRDSEDRVSVIYVSSATYRINDLVGFIPVRRAWDC